MREIKLICVDNQTVINDCKSGSYVFYTVLGCIFAVVNGEKSHHFGNFGKKVKNFKVKLKVESMVKIDSKFSY